MSINLIALTFFFSDSEYRKGLEFDYDYMFETKVTRKPTTVTTVNNK